MKTYTHIYRDDQQLEIYIEQHHVLACENLLIQLFCGNNDPDFFMPIAARLREVLPQSQIIGTTTSGEIHGGEILTNELLISFSLFDSTKIRSGHYAVASDQIPFIKKDLFAEDTRALIIFADGLMSNAEPFIKQLHTIDHDVVIAGGRAGDNNQFVKTFVFTDDYYTDDGCVIVSLSSDHLLVNSKYILNWTAIGKLMTVTRCDGNVLYELDGTPVTNVYKKYLGADVVKNLPASAMPFPLITHKGTIEVARDPVALADEGGMVYAGDFEKGDKVRFSFADIADLTDNLDNVFADYSNLPAEAVYIYSCAARSILLGNKLCDEFILLDSLAPAVGFFTYGEFYSAEKITQLLNVTTTFIMLAEQPDIGERSYHSNSKGDFDPVRKALTHLIKVTNKELEYVSTRDVLTGLYNRAEYTVNLEKKIHSAQRYHHSFGMIMIDIDHFKKINDQYGHNAGDKVIQAVAQTIFEQVRRDDFVARWGGEEFVVISNNVDEMEMLERITQLLQQQIRNIEVDNISNISASFGLTIYRPGDTQESLFQRIDKALYKAKALGRDRYEIT